MSKISDIVNNFLMENGLSESEYVKCFHIARKGLAELQKDIAPELVRECANINDNLTIDFPSGAVRVYNVGFFEGDRFISYTVNPNLGNRPNRCHICKEAEHRCDCNTNHPANISKSLGVGSWVNRGEYNIKDRVIYLSSDLKNEDVYIEYSTYDQSDTDPEVDPVLEEAMESYLAWRFFRTRNNVGLSEKRDYKQQYIIDKRKAKLRKNSISRSQINQVVREHVKMGLKS